MRSGHPAQCSKPNWLGAEGAAAGRGPDPAADRRADRVRAGLRAAAPRAAAGAGATAGAGGGGGAAAGAGRRRRGGRRRRAGRRCGPRGGSPAGFRRSGRREGGRRSSALLSRPLGLGAAARPRVRRASAAAAVEPDVGGQRRRARAARADPGRTSDRQRARAEPGGEPADVAPADPCACPSAPTSPRRGRMPPAIVVRRSERVRIRTGADARSGDPGRAPRRDRDRTPVGGSSPAAASRPRRPGACASSPTRSASATRPTTASSASRPRARCSTTSTTT